MTWVAAGVELTRRLAGRLTDDALATTRSFLGAHEQSMFEPVLADALVREQVPLDAAEYDLLAAAEVRLVHGMAFAEDAAVLRYAFQPRVLAPVLAEHPLHVLGFARSDVDGAVAYQTWRRPLAGARQGAGWVYLLEVTAGRAVERVQAAVQGTPGAVGVEVFATGEDLPPYQAAARAGAHVVR